MKQRVKDEPKETIKQIHGTLSGMKQRQTLAIRDVNEGGKFLWYSSVSAGDSEWSEYIVHGSGGIVDIYESDEIEKAEERPVLSVDTYLYVGFGDSSTSEKGIAVLGRSDPTDLTAITRLVDSELDDTAGFDTDGDYLYVSNVSRFLIIDIRDRENPSKIASLDTSHLDDARTVRVSGDYAYVANETDTDSGTALTVFDISNPNSPSIETTKTRSQLGFSGRGIIGLAIKHAHLLGTVAVTAGGESSFLSIDISDPTNPTVVANNENVSSKGSIAIVGDTAFVAADGAISSIDISDPSDPQFINEVFPQSNSSGQNVVTNGEHVFVTGDIVTKFDTDLNLLNMFGNNRKKGVVQDFDKEQAIAGEFMYLSGQGEESTTGSVAAIDVSGDSQGFIASIEMLFETGGSGSIQELYPSGSIDSFDWKIEWWIDRSRTLEWTSRLENDITYSVIVTYYNRTSSSGGVATLVQARSTSGHGAVVNSDVNFTT